MPNFLSVHTIGHPPSRIRLYFAPNGIKPINRRYAAKCNDRITTRSKHRHLLVLALTVVIALGTTTFIPRFAAAAPPPKNDAPAPPQIHDANHPPSPSTTSGLVVLSSAASAACLAVVLSLHLIKQHLNAYVQPSFQLYICRILFMVPLFAVQSFVSFIFPPLAVFLDALRDCYEAFVLYTFLTLLMNFLGGEELIVLKFSQMGRYMDHPLPCGKICRPLRLGRKFLRRTKRGVMQFVFVKPVTAIWDLCTNPLLRSAASPTPSRLPLVAFWATLTKGNAWVFLINNVSVGVAMYSLVLFYKSNYRGLAPFRPVPKFVCVKIIVFLSFWQSHLLSALLHLGFLPSSMSQVFLPDDTASMLHSTHLVQRLNEWLLCFEMLLIAVIHIVAFSPAEFLYSPLGGGEPSSTTKGKFTPAPLSRYLDDAAHPKPPNLNQVLQVGDFLRDAKITFVKSSGDGSEAHRGGEETELLPLPGVVGWGGEENELLAAV